MERTFFVGGNWKCNGTTKSITELIEKINEGPSISGEPVEAVVGVPFPYLSLVRQKLRKDWGVSAQNCWKGDGGAFTGEVRDHAHQTWKTKKRADTKILR